MTDDVEPTLVQVPVLPRQMPEIEEFQRIEGLATRADALALLLEIALDAITSPGRRFWDRATTRPVVATPSSFAEVFRSSNGDTWLLGRNALSGRRVVRHEPNPSSGGAVSEVEVETFLQRDSSGPEFAALRALLSKGAVDD